MKLLPRFAFVTCFALLSEACGGRVDPDTSACPPGAHCLPDGDASPDDSGVLPDSALPDTSEPPPPDAFPETYYPPPPDTGTCGSGACAPGYTCPIPCGSCTCGADGSWTCGSSTDCYDADPPIDAYPVCPPYEPSDGESCGLPDGTSCGWTNACGSADYGYCYGGRWSLKVSACDGGCPSYRPALGSSCTSTAPYPYCKYVSACGSIDLAYCTSGTWTYAPSDCPPPVPPCPFTLPTDGSYCPVEKQECDYKSACGTLDYAVCSGGSWRAKSSCTGGSCPTTAPRSGAACSTPGATMCSYPTSPSCSMECFCAKDFRWACYDDPCFPFPDAGYEDAGPIYDAYPF